MAKLKLAFAYQGHQPGDVVDVPNEAVKDLVRAGIGHLEGSEPVLRFGRLPEVTEPVRSTHELPKRGRKPEASEPPAE
ncbi:hypothetical protein PV733_28100 [Streptomyces europaeiscabiei]|uniref:hypothetical protein n=1 Tax=Streptomyces europaeiscabiei TaxID=146819 RepID=UPI0029BDEB6F|nr:hypothetical protein [Streptomyces europaeiscabiei]MDX3712733.1 hypothetical protein [Streptomyces europaeiscabiei]